MDASTRRHAVTALSAEEFEWLVHALVEAEEADSSLVRKMRAPDGGADTLVLREDGSVRRAVQAKRHGNRINWSKCSASLEQAAAVWKPEEVLFTFACDFSQGDQENFQARLVQRDDGIRVTAWTLSDIERLLDKHAAVGPRFLGPDAHAVSALIQRAARLAVRGSSQSFSDGETSARHLNCAAREWGVDVPHATLQCKVFRLALIHP